jgi:hypothetical protein
VGESAEVVFARLLAFLDKDCPSAAGGGSNDTPAATLESHGWYDVKFIDPVIPLTVSAHMHLGVGGRAPSGPDRPARRGEDGAASQRRLPRPTGPMAERVDRVRAPAPHPAFGGQEQPGWYTFNVIAPR